MDQSQKLKRESLKFTPLLAQSFSRINDSVISNLTDSGYSSSLHSTFSRSFTPSESNCNSLDQYCSTPITGVQSIKIVKNSEGKTDTSSLSIPRTPQFSEDRIPLASRTNTSITKTSEEKGDNSLLGKLITHQTLSALKKIFYYLNPEDLLRFCQVSSAHCGAVCDDSAALMRLSRYLINLQQNGENRLVIGHRARVRPAAILRPIQNILNASGDQVSAASWTIPSPLENVATSDCPPLLKKLIGMTKSLTDHSCIARCHSCRCFVPVKLYHKKPVSCSQCSLASHRTKRKINLFSSLR